MDYLDLFERNIELYDGMLVETGGSFGRGKLGGDQYENKCLDIALKYMENGGSKESILDIIDRCIEQYEAETEWLYWHLEMAFLNSLRDKIQ